MPYDVMPHPVFLRAKTRFYCNMAGSVKERWKITETRQLRKGAHFQFCSIFVCNFVCVLSAKVPEIGEWQKNAYEIFMRWCACMDSSSREYLRTGGEAEISFSPHFVHVPIAIKWNGVLLVPSTSTNFLHYVRTRAAFIDSNEHHHSYIDYMLYY